MEKEKIKALAIKTYNKYKTSDPFSICKQKGYEVIKIPMPLKLKGYTTEKNRIKFIYINNQYSYEEQYFTCVHELGHNICKHEDNILFNHLYTYHLSNREENEANIFAASFILAKYSEEQLEGLTITQISQMTGIDEKHLRLLF